MIPKSGRNIGKIALFAFVEERVGKTVGFRTPPLMVREWRPVLALKKSLFKWGFPDTPILKTPGPLALAPLG